MIVLGLKIPGICSRSHKSGYAWHLRFHLSGDVQDGFRPPAGMVKHPDHQLASLLNRVIKSWLAPDAIRFGLTPNRTMLTPKIASDNRAHQCFLSVARDLIGGSTQR
jgi:hypothetical protein